QLAGATDAVVPGVTLRLVQGDVEQQANWDPARARLIFDRYLELSARPATPPPTLIVWPGGAGPHQIDAEPLVRAYLARIIPADGRLLTGGDRVDPTAAPRQVTNSLFALAPGGAVLGRYDKVDLVPFGEFLPFRPLLGALGMGKLT